MRKMTFKDFSTRAKKGNFFENLRIWVYVRGLWGWGVKMKENGF